MGDRLPRTCGNRATLRWLLSWAKEERAIRQRARMRRRMITLGPPGSMLAGRLFQFVSQSPDHRTLEIQGWTWLGCYKAGVSRVFWRQDGWPPGKYSGPWLVTRYELCRNPGDVFEATLIYVGPDATGDPFKEPRYRVGFVRSVEPHVGPDATGDPLSANES